MSSLWIKSIINRKKGFGVGKAAAGVLLTGGVGLLAGFVGSNKAEITCLKCGKTFKPGEGVTKLEYDIKQKNKNDTMPTIVASIFIGIILLVIFLIHII